MINLDILLDIRILMLFHGIFTLIIVIRKYSFLHYMIVKLMIPIFFLVWILFAMALLEFLGETMSIVLGIIMFFTGIYAGKAFLNTLVAERDEGVELSITTFEYGHFMKSTTYSRTISYASAEVLGIALIVLYTMLGQCIAWFAM